MTRPPSGARPDGAARRAAFGGALLAGTALLAVLAWRGQIDAIHVLVALAALAASLAVPSLLPASARRPAAEPRPATAGMLLSGIPDPVVLVARDGVVRAFNEAAQGVLPLLEAGEPLSFALRAPDVLDGIERAARTGETQRVEYHQPVPADLTFEVQIGPAGADGAPGLLLFFRDVTSARRIERMRVDFVANASHELRTPLASLLGFVETLQGPARDDPAARERFLAIMRGQALRMSRLIEDLLSLSRIEARVHQQPTTVVDLVPVIRQVADGMAPLARESGVGIALDIADGPLALRGDRDELARLVENLVENGIKYGQSGGRVEITARRRAAADGRPAEIELAVRDHGPGIPPEHLPRLTERFYRADVAESRQKGGTGLGLAIVKHIVARHRGRLRIDSEPGQGALFTVTLPAAPAGPG